ncbi:MAG: nucleotide-binding protein [Actinomycetota bacterium]|nr:nucleotide-binding protein [Actinomycetota bacterium]
MISYDEAEPTGRAVAERSLDDTFADDRPAGRVVGTRTASGAVRHGIDVEGLIAIDNGALRLRPLAQPGWGREGVAYGPFRRTPGLALSAHVLNGHNASQTYYTKERFRERARQWAADALRGRFRRPHHYENLAVGFFPSPAPTDPTRQGDGFVMHAATADNGELWAGVSGAPMRLARGVQNLEILFVVILRARGAAYYVASLDGALGLGGYPDMRPVAIDTTADDTDVYAGVHQRILGEVGYRVDTRVYGVRAEEVPACAAWYGTAHVADRLDGSGPLCGSPAEVGGSWSAQWGDLTRTADGACAGSAGGRSLVDVSETTGLVHAMLHTGRRPAPAGLCWRSDVDSGSTWTFAVGPAGATLTFDTEGRAELVRSSNRWKVKPRGTHAVQVLDDGRSFGVYLDGRLVFDDWIVDSRNGAATGAGIALTGGSDDRVRDFEVHARRVRIPPQLDLGPPWSPQESREVFVERFETPADDLHGAPVAGSDKRWERTVGEGVIVPTGTCARVRATREQPNPGRTIYTVPWDSPDLADISLEMSPPGTRSKEGHAGRGGLTFWQDEDNYLVVNVFIDDTFDGASISSFYHLGGKEDMYDAVWTLVRGVRWGERCALRVAFDGRQFLASMNGEPSLYRALTDVYPDAVPLEIRRVGMIVNWEWGDDTGTTFWRMDARGGRST